MPKSEVGDTKYYAYFFTVQDMTPEQQIVQTAHAALKLGAYSNQEWDKGAERDLLTNSQIKDFNPNNIYFTVVGVRNDLAMEGVISILEKFDYQFTVFAEPDQGNRITSVATYPIREDCRGALHAFNLLTV